MNNLLPMNYMVDDNQSISVSATIKKILRYAQNDSTITKKVCEDTDLGRYILRPARFGKKY